MKNTTEQKHTPTPWKNDGIRILASDGLVVGIVGNWGDIRPEYMENAAFIVRAVNSHSILLKAAKAYLESVENDLGVVDIEESEIEELRTAIAEAEGE